MDRRAHRAVLTIIRALFEVTRIPIRAAARKILFVKFAEEGMPVLAYPAIGRAIEMVGENV